MAVKPSKASKSSQQRIAMTDRQARRLAEGITEGSPEDYGITGSEELLRLRDARRKLEDRKVERELGLEGWAA